MFAPNDFDSAIHPTPPEQSMRSPLPPERLIGLIALLLLLALCLIMSISSDAEVFLPYSTLRSQTLTAQPPGTPPNGIAPDVPPVFPFPSPMPQATPTLRNEDQAAQRVSTSVR